MIGEKFIPDFGARAASVSEKTRLPCPRMGADWTMEVAIIGGGPAGLSAALEMAGLPHVNWQLYEKKSQISETGGGMSLQTHIWKLLQLNGTARHISPTDYFRTPNGLVEQRR